MALRATLEADFGAGGFSLSGTVEGLGGDLDAVAVPDVPLDTDALAAAVDGLGAVDVSAAAGAVGVVADALATAGVGLPAVDDLRGPITAILEAAAALGELDLAGPANAFAAAGQALDSGGLDALRSLTGGLAGAFDSPSFAAVVELVGVLIPGGLDLGVVLDGLGPDAQGLVVALQAVGALMATQSATREIAEGARLVEGMLTPAEVDELTRRLSQWKDQDLADLLLGVDLADPGLIEIVAGPILAMTADVRTAADALTRGLGFGHAALVGLDLPGLVAKLDAATALVREDALDAVRALAERISDALAPALSIALPEPAESVEAFWAVVADQLTGLAGAVDSLDPAALASGLTGGLGKVTDLVGEIAAAAEAVVVAARSAFETVRRALATVDLGPITDALDTVVDPIQAVLDDVTALVGDAQTTIEDVSVVVVAAMDTVRDAFETAAGVVAGAFGRIGAVLDAIGLAELQTDLEAALAPIVSAVGGIHLAPVFDTANDVIDTTADVVGAVPLGLLPADAKADLAEAVRPVKEIDFQRDVADVLNARMAEILAALDTGILAEVDAAHRDVIAFLDSVDPRVPLGQLESEVFDPFLDGLRALDLDALLAPLADALAPIQGALAELDLSADLFAPVEALIDDLGARIAVLDPSSLFAPVDAQVDEVRTQLTDALHLDEIDGWLDEAETTITAWLSGLDLDRFVAALDAAYAPLVRELTGAVGGANPLATAITMLMDGAGVRIRTDAFTEVTTWVRGATAGAAVQARLDDAATRIEALHAATGALDLAGLVVDLAPGYRALRDAVLALPADSPMRATVELEVLGASPLELLGPFVDSFAPYRAALGGAALALRQAAGSARSQLDAVAGGLRDALRPLAAITDWLRAVATRSGLDADLGLGAVIAELLTRLTPSIVLEPVVEGLRNLLGRIEALAVTGVLGPAREAVADVSAALAAIDLSFVTTELGAVFAAVNGVLDGFRPTAVLGDRIATVTALRDALGGFDPLGPVEAAVDALSGAITDGAEALRPTVIFAPAVMLYDEIVASLGALDVRALLDPLLVVLDDLAVELGGGLDGLAVSLGRLQAALPDPDSLAVGGSVSVVVG